MAQRQLFVATRKGLFVLRADARRQAWTLEGPHFLGEIVNHALTDPRDGRTTLAAVRAGHLGPTVMRSEDGGRTWKEASRPPAFAKAPEGESGPAVGHVFWLTPGHPSNPGRWYAGTSPQGLFVSNDGGDTWEGVEGFNGDRDAKPWIASGPDGPPDGATLHSINVDPHDSAHLMLGLSSGGVFESRDEGATWAPLNRGCAADFLPDPDPPYGHDPHCVRMHPTARDVVFQQNHCGIYRLDRPANRWVRIGEAMPRPIGDIGFPVVLHPRDPDTLWVFPMDGTTVWPRLPIGGRPAAYRSRDAGQTWQRCDEGLPRQQAWFTVKRQAMTCDDADPVGVYFGTTGGEVWGSFDEGDRWQCLCLHLPHIYALEMARVE